MKVYKGVVVVVVVVVVVALVMIKQLIVVKKHAKLVSGRFVSSVLRATGTAKCRHFFVVAFCKSEPSALKCSSFADAFKM